MSKNFSHDVSRTGVIRLFYINASRLGPTYITAADIIGEIFTIVISPETTSAVRKGDSTISQITIFCLKTNESKINSGRLLLQM